MTAEQTPPQVFRSGFITLAGAPNAGKSTLLNRLLGEKISITSRKPQTTRNRILGVLHRPEAQLIFYDTPGVFKAADRMNLRIVEAALSALGDADLIVLVVDAASPAPAAEGFLLEHLRQVRSPVILALNKIDLVAKIALLPLIDRWRQAFDFREVVPVSALDGTQLDTLVSAMVAALPAGPPYYPEDALTDLPQRFLAAELIREKVFRLTGQEIPYATAVTVETFKTDEDKDLVTIEATIHLERSSQKAIVIGRQGRMLKRIGTEARRDIEAMLETRVYLKLFVAVQKNWRRDPRALRRFGY